MQTYDLIDKDRLIFAFEIDAIGRRKAVALVSAIPQVFILKGPKFLSFIREEVFCEFALGTCRLKIMEPFFMGNKRYWIGPVDSPTWHPEVTIVRQALIDAKVVKS